MILLYCLTLVDWPCSLIQVQVTVKNNVYLVLIDQILQKQSQLSYGGILHLIRAVKSPMSTQNDPFNVRIRFGFLEIIFQELVLFRSLSIRMFRRNMNHMNLPVIKGKPKICLICLVSWKFVPGKV